MSHTNKFTRNARLRRFAPGSAPAENSAPPAFVGPPYAFREYLGGEFWVAPGPPPPPPPPSPGAGAIAAQPPVPPYAGRCSGYACGLGQEPGDGLLRQMGHVQFTPGRENRNRGLEAHRPVVFQFPKKVPKIPVALRASFQSQNNMTEEQRQRALAFDVAEYRAKMRALMVAADIKARGGSLEEQTLVYLATLSAALQKSGMNQETIQIMLEDARKERNMQNPKKKAEIVKRRKNYRNKYTKKNKNKNGNGNSN